jgi:hypothetical protein
MGLSTSSHIVRITLLVIGAVALIVDGHAEFGAPLLLVAAAFAWLVARRQRRSG